MKSTEIQNSVQTLIDNFSPQKFIYDLLMAYGISKTSVTRLKKGDYNLSQNKDEVLYKKKVFFKTETSDKLLSSIEVVAKDDKILKVDKKDDNFLEQKFGISNPKMLIGSLRSGKKGNYGLRYQFAFSFNNPTLNSENPDFKSVQDWLYLNIKKAEKYYDGEKITFTEFNLK